METKHTPGPWTLERHIDQNEYGWSLVTMKHNKNYIPDAKCMPTELRARKMLRSAMRRRVELSEALHVTLDGPAWESREAFVAQAERAWEAIEQLESEALIVDPGVHKKQTIASGVVKL